MEIKVQCDCGQKFKFDVEPVNGQMPLTVTCPVCGLDGTPRANVILQQQLAAMPPQPAAAPRPIGLSIAQPPQAASPAPSAPPPPAPMRPTGLSINRPPAQHPPPPKAAASDADEDESDASDDKGGVHDVKLGIKGYALIGLVILLGIGGSWLKSAEKNLIRTTLDWIWDKATGSSSSNKDAETKTPANSSAGKPASSDAATNSSSVLPDDDGTLIVVKSSDQATVVQACSEFYLQTYKQKLFNGTTTNVHEPTDGALYLVTPPANGSIEINGPLFWNDQNTATMTGMAEFISKKLNTTVVCALMGDDAETGIVTIYENGEKKFSVHHSITIAKGDIKDTYRVTGQEWAGGMGFKPGGKGYSEFSMEEAERLVQHLGFKSDGVTPAGCVVLSKTPIK